MAEPTKDALPPCFGNPKLWDPKAVECIGGTDPAYTDEKGGHVRGKCECFEACGVRAQASKMEGARSLLDPRSLVKNNVPVLGPARPVEAPVQQSQLGTFVDRFAQAVINHPQGLTPQQQQMLYGRPMQPGQPQVQGQMPMGYQAMMPVNFQMPGYLSVPETRHPGQSFWSFLGITVFRAIGKSLGHSIAHLFDHVPLGGVRIDGGSSTEPR